MTAGQLAAIAALVAGGAASTLLLRNAWQSRSVSRAWMIAGGWAAIAVLLVAGAPLLGTARSIFIAITLISVAALAIVATGIQFRPARAAVDRASIALEPSDRPSRVWRGVLRFLLAGPIGGIAAIGVGVAWAVWLPSDPQTRIVTSGLVVPVLWGGLMAWTLADDRIIRATAVLVGVAVVTFSFAAIRGFG